MGGADKRFFYDAATTARATTTALTEVEAAIVAATSTSASFRPGVAASGTATRLVGDTPPTRSRDLNTVNSSAYSVSFASAQSGYSVTQKALSTGAGAAAGSTSSGFELSQGALIGIIAGAAGGGVVLLAIIGYCCWKRKKAKKAEQEWWNPKDAGPGGVLRSGGGGGGATADVKADGSAWESTDSLAHNGGYAGGEKGWAAQSSVSLATTATEKGGAYPPPPNFAAQNLDAARCELFASRATPPARSMTPASMASSAPYGRQRMPTDVHSVNDIISFSGQPRAGAQYPPASSIYPPSAAMGGMTPSSSRQELVRSPPPFQQYPATPPPAHPLQHSYGSPAASHASPAPQAMYPPVRPARPSEVPSAPPSPYNRAVAAVQRETEQRNEELENRFMDVMTGRVGQDEDEPAQQVEKLDERRKKRQSMAVNREALQRKKDTIIGLAEAYGGEEWSQVDIEAPARQDLPQRTSSKRTAGPSSHAAAPPPVPALSPTIDAFPVPPQSTPTHAAPPSSTSNNRYSTRIDSKPLRELESYFNKMPPIASTSRRIPRASEASDISSAIDPRRQSRISVASSTAPLSLPRRPAAAVPQSGSKDSLSPIPAAAGGHHSPYGETTRYAHSIYSATGELGELSSASGSTTSSPAKVRRPGFMAIDGVSPSSSLSPLGSPLSERPPALAASSSSLAIGVIAASNSQSAVAPSSSTPPRALGRPLPAITSTRQPPPAPLRLARNASLANRPLPSQPRKPLTLTNPDPPTPSLARDPLTMSAAERDVLAELGLPTPTPTASILSASTSSASLSMGDRTPDLTRSTSSPLDSPDTSLDTPSTPVFPPKPGTGGSFLDMHAASAPSKPPMLAPPAPAPAAKRQEYLDPLAADGWESLAAMAAQNQDPNYRSATMSIYGMYD
ncbi:hypothetical protein JCM10207_007345 [Rhodosporidiobolus poonsookiae]